MPMEEVDHEVANKTNPLDDEELLMNEVVRGDADLFYLHHYLTDVLRQEEI